MKTCSKCKAEKPLDQFRLVRDSWKKKDGTETVKHYPRPRCMTCEKEDRAANPRCQTKNKRYYVESNFNITMEEYDKFMETGCLICGSFENLHLDHDHKCCSGKVSCGKCIRGALCRPHNMALGLFDDNVEHLMGAATYLLAFENLLEEVSA